MAAWEGLEEAMAIADAGSFAGAAARLGVSSSHVSRVVARLEDRLGARLFHRTTRRVSLTDTGRTFIEQCQRLIQDRDELLASAEGSGEPQGELRVSCSITLGERFVAPIVMAYAREFPRLRVQLDLSNRMIDIVGEGYDLAVRTGNISDMRLVGRQIAVRPLETCASPQYLAEHGEPAHPSDLPRHRCVIGTTGTWHFLDGATPRLFSPQSAWRCNSGKIIVEAAAQGMGICQLPGFYVTRAIAEGRLRPILRRYKSAPEPVWAAYPQKRHLQPKVKQLVERLQSSLQYRINHDVDFD